MIKEATGFGATVDEALENAKKNLNASEFDDIQFDVISTPKKKILGLFGGTQAEVRAYVETPDKKRNEKAQAKKGKNEQPKKNTADKSAQKPSPAKENAKKVDNVPTEEKKSPSDPSAYGEPVDADSLPADSNAAKAVAYIKTIVAALNCNPTSFKVATRENAALILIDGEDLNILIGRRAETLDSIQYLASLAANNGGGHYKVSINIGDYREKREATLIALANKLAAQALQSGKCRTLEPMNPYERRIIHTAVQAIDGVESASFGEGVERRVVIAPTGVEMKPRKNYSGNGRRNDHRGGRRNDRPKTTPVAPPSREPMKDSDTPLYGKIN